MGFSKYVIIVAGGTGTRMGTAAPKQLLLLKGKPVILHTIEQFLNYDPTIRVIVVMHPQFMEVFQELLKAHELQYPITLTAGGHTRFHSVKNGLQLIKDDQAIVGIHDAARPLVSIATIASCYETAAEKGNAIPVVTLNESIREVEGAANRAVDRSRFRVIQTPQCFRATLIQAAFQQAYSDAFTDDATVLEQHGHPIHLVPGNPENIKITTPSDLRIAETFIDGSL